MKGAVLYGPGDVRLEERDEPTIVEPTDAITRLSATCVCGSDLWPYRGIGVDPHAAPTPMGHEYSGIVEAVGRAVASIKRGQFVIGSFFASDNTCPNCQAGYQSSCQHRQFVGGAQASRLRVPLADGTLVATPDIPSSDLVWNGTIDPGKVFDLSLPLQQLRGLSPLATGLAFVPMTGLTGVVTLVAPRETFVQGLQVSLVIAALLLVVTALASLQLRPKEVHA
jgi:threonine dehydrogenase-like Zn-dependent dehydrogenase